jgi:phage protein D
MDGIITNQQFNPGSQPGSSTFTITGEDVSVMMDRQEKNVEHPAQNEMVIALKIIASYAQYGLIPKVLPPPTLDVPLPTDRIPVQQATDLQYLLEMAQRFDYVFYVIPGPAPGVNQAYWGPPLRAGLPQKALTFNMGPSSNVSQLDIQNNANAPTTVSGNVQDRSTNQSMPVQSMAGSRLPLSLELPNPATMRTTVLRQSASSAAQAMTRAQAITDASLNEVVTVSGELDAAVYGELLTARELVGLRGAGFKHDGLYYVKQVTHQIARGQYKQRFTLTREGLGANIPVVRP